MLVEKRKTQKAEIPTASLADIVFLLLIFFLVTTTINTDKGISLLLPAAGQTKSVPKKNLLNILINDYGDVLLQGEPIQIPYIQNEIKRRIQENPNLIVSVKTGKKTKYEIFIAVMDQLKLAEAKRISIAEPEA
ncbi:MAG: biopolymer transporter ExbD [Candidatus Helarchaeota archaeon]|nr:biopolymer transporter ExbD [Candidatus Helarchaeota archaeon]